MGDLVERIRSRPNDAPMPTEHLLDEAATELARLGALVEEAREALRPFADQAEWHNDCEQHPGGCPDDASLGEVVDLTVGDCRRARATLGRMG